MATSLEKYRYVTLHPYDNNEIELLPKVAYLTIKVNGTSYNYNGTNALNVNITANALGALTSADLSNYVTKDDLTNANYATETYVTNTIKAVTDNGIVNSVASDTLTITGTEKTYTSGTTSVTGYNGDIKVELKSIATSDNQYVVGVSDFSSSSTNTYTILRKTINVDSYGRVKSVISNGESPYLATITSGDGILLTNGVNFNSDDTKRQYGEPTISLAESGITANTYGSYSAGSVVLPSITFDKYGRATSASTTTFNVVNTLKYGDGITITSDSGDNTNGFKGNSTIALSTSGVTSGTYGENDDVLAESVIIPKIVVDKYGRITSVKNQEVVISQNTYYKYAFLIKLRSLVNTTRVAEIKVDFISSVNLLNGDVIWANTQSSNDLQTNFNTLTATTIFAINNDDNLKSTLSIPNVKVKIYDENETITPWVCENFIDNEHTTLFAIVPIDSWYGESYLQSNLQGLLDTALGLGEGGFYLYGNKIGAEYIYAYKEIL